MAHFAQLDSNNHVVNIFVVDNNDCLDDNGVESEIVGVAFLRRVMSDNSLNFVQTSYNGNFRKNYAGIGFTYDSQRDAFIPPKPYQSWTLNEDTCLWEAPIDIPGYDKLYNWNEDTTSWVEVE